MNSLTRNIVISACLTIASVSAVAGGSISVKGTIEESSKKAYEDGYSSALLAEKGKRNNPKIDTSDWDANYNRLWLEKSIKNDSMNLRTKQAMKVTGAACFPTTTVNRWSCSYRLLGEYQSKLMGVEVDLAQKDWTSY